MHENDSVAPPLGESRKLRICMLVSNDMTHDSRVDRQAKALGQRGHDVVVLARASSNEQTRIEDRKDYVVRRYVEPFLGPRATPKQDKISQLGASSTRSQLLVKLFRATRRIALVLTARLWLYHLAASMRANVYHCNDLDTLDIGAAMRITGKMVVYDSHEIYVEEIAWRPLRALYFAFEKLLAKFADVIITVNPLIADELQKRYRIRDRIHVVLNCPDAPPGHPPQPQPASHPQLITVLYHGGLNPERGLENLILATEFFRQGIRLVFRGEGVLEEKLKKLASGRNNISFEGPVPLSEVVKAASEADIGVIPYLPVSLNQIYSSPNKLFEYMQAGLVLATSDAPFLRKVVIGHSIGVVFDPDDPSDIGRKINFASERDNLDRFRRNVQQIRSHYTWMNEKQNLYEAYAPLERPKGAR